MCVRVYTINQTVNWLWKGQDELKIYKESRGHGRDKTVSIATIDEVNWLLRQHDVFALRNNL